MHDTRGSTETTTLADVWLTFTGSVVQGAAAANKAALSVFTPEAAPETNGTSREEDVVPPAVSSVAYDERDWEFERSADTRAELGVGDTVTFSKILDEDDVQSFARASGDTNRLHLDDAFAEGTRFGGRIAHGTLVSGLISAALARLPGLTVYLSQDLEFRHPVQIGDRISAEVEVVEDLGDEQYRLTTIITDEDEEATIIDGEAVVLIDDFPEN